MPLSSSEEIKAEVAEIHLALGRAMASWSMVEDEVCQIFCIALFGTFPSVPRIPIQAVNAFYSVRSFVGKLEMTDAAIMVTLEHLPVYLRTWKVLYNKAKRQNKERNKLAHSYIARPTYSLSDFSVNNSEITLDPFDSWLRRVVRMYGSGATTIEERDAAGNNTKSLTLSDVSARSESFKRLSDRLHRFHIILDGTLRPDLQTTEQP